MIGLAEPWKFLAIWALSIVLFWCCMALAYIVTLVVRAAWHSEHKS